VKSGKTPGFRTPALPPGVFVLFDRNRADLAEISEIIREFALRTRSAARSEARNHCGIGALTLSARREIAARHGRANR